MRRLPGKTQAIPATPTIAHQSDRGFDAMRFAAQGFLIIDNALGPDLLARARDESTAICRGRRGRVDGLAAGAHDEDDLDVLRRYLCIHFPHKLSQCMAISRPSLRWSSRSPRSSGPT